MTMKAKIRICQRYIVCAALLALLCLKVETRERRTGL